MKFLLAKKPEIITKSLKENNMQALFVDFHCHPIELAKTVHDFIKKEQEQDNGVYVTYNIMALNLIPVDMILWLEDNGDNTPTIHSFSEVFSDYYEQGFLTGDIFEIITYSVGTEGEIPLDPNFLVNNKVHYSVPTNNGMLFNMFNDLMNNNDSLPDKDKYLLSKIASILEDGKNA